MLKEIKDYAGYDDIFRWYVEGYENDWYRVFFECKADENGNKIEPQDPTDDKQFKIIVGRKDGVGVRITIREVFKVGKPRDEYDYAHNISVGHLMENDHVYFDNLIDSKEDWAEAGQTVVEIDTLVRNVFPGYYITDKKTW